MCAHLLNQHFIVFLTRHEKYQQVLGINIEKTLNKNDVDLRDFCLVCQDLKQIRTFLDVSTEGSNLTQAALYYFFNRISDLPNKQTIMDTI